MNKIGIIGGMTPESTILYYQILNRLAEEYKGISHTAEVIINSVDFGVISKHQEKGEWSILNKLMAQAALDIEKAGAHCILIGANTMHLCYDYAQSKVTVPIIHIAEATAEAIRNKGFKKVGLLGTKYTMEKDFYKSILLDHGIETLIPNEMERQYVHDVIYQELAKGIFSEKAKYDYQIIIENLVSQGAQGIILGCTEIPLLISNQDTIIPLFNTTEIHARKAMELSVRK